MAAVACDVALQRGDRHSAMRYLDELRHVLLQIQRVRPLPGQETLERARAESRIDILRRQERRLGLVCGALRHAAECN
jgi:hypothetical protein